MYCMRSCKVAVNYIIYDPKRKIIINKGSSRPCGINHKRYSVHAEQKAILYCLNKDKRNRYEIYISF